MTESWHLLLGFDLLLHFAAKEIRSQIRGIYRLDHPKVILGNRMLLCRGRVVRVREAYNFLPLNASTLAVDCSQSNLYYS